MLHRSARNRPPATDEITRASRRGEPLATGRHESTEHAVLEWIVTAKAVERASHRGRWQGTTMNIASYSEESQCSQRPRGTHDPLSICLLQFPRTSPRLE